MSRSIRLSPDARKQAHEADDWWRENRPAARDSFRDELVGALALLVEAPDIGRRMVGPRIPGLRRLLLPSVRYHVYYVHEEAAHRIVVLAIWSAVRGRRPRLQRP